MGDVICEKGNEAGELYFIDFGTIAIATKPKLKKVCDAAPGDGKRAAMGGVRSAPRMRRVSAWERSARSEASLSDFRAFPRRPVKSPSRGRCVPCASPALMVPTPSPLPQLLKTSTLLPLRRFSKQSSAASSDTERSSSDSTAKGGSERRTSQGGLGIFMKGSTVLARKLSSSGARHSRHRKEQHASADDATYLTR